MFFLPGMTSKRNFPPSSPLDGCSETLFPGRKIVPCGKQRGSFRTQVLVSSFQIRTFCLEQTSKFVRLYVRSRCNTSGSHGLQGIFFQVLKTTVIYTVMLVFPNTLEALEMEVLCILDLTLFTVCIKSDQIASNSPPFFCTRDTAFSFGSRRRKTFQVFSQMKSWAQHDTSSHILPQEKCV